MPGNLVKAKTPRQMWVADGERKLSATELERILPYVDLNTGVKNRILERDPISGLGDIHDTKAPAPTPSRKNNYDPNRDPIVGSGKLGEEASAFTPRKTKQREERDPILQTGNIGKEFDPINPTGRPKGTVLHEPSRDPVRGTGDFGVREYDPVWKYRGKVRTDTSSTVQSYQGNPITGTNMKSFDLAVDERKLLEGRRKQNESKNVLTGASCNDYDITAEMKPRPLRKNKSVHNILTGENCQDYDLSIENATRKTVNKNAQFGRKWSVTDACNPILGQNCKTFNYSVEKPHVLSKPYEYVNPLTGENRPHYTVIPNEKARLQKQYTGLDNPIKGSADKPSYDLNPGMKQRNAKENVTSSNPLTGDNCNQFVLSKEDKRRVKEGGKPQPSRNALTGENCEVYYLGAGFRSDQKASLEEKGVVQDADRGNRTQSSRANYNILSGEN